MPSASTLTRRPAPEFAFRISRGENCPPIKLRSKSEVDWRLDFLADKLREYTYVAVGIILKRHAECECAPVIVSAFKIKPVNKDVENCDPCHQTAPVVTAHLAQSTLCPATDSTLNRIKAPTHWCRNIRSKCPVLNRIALKKRCRFLPIHAPWIILMGSVQWIHEVKPHIAMNAAVRRMPHC